MFLFTFFTTLVCFASRLTFSHYNLNLFVCQPRFVIQSTSANWVFRWTQLIYACKPALTRWQLGQGLLKHVLFGFIELGSHQFIEIERRGFKCFFGILWFYFYFHLLSSIFQKRLLGCALRYFLLSTLLGWSHQFIDV